MYKEDWKAAKSKAQCVQMVVYTRDADTRYSILDGVGDGVMMLQKFFSLSFQHHARLTVDGDGMLVPGKLWPLVSPIPAPSGTFAPPTLGPRYGAKAPSSQLSCYLDDRRGTR